jgi:hypothetical protein
MSSLEQELRDAKDELKETTTTYNNAVKNWTSTHWLNIFSKAEKKQAMDAAERVVIRIETRVTELEKLILEEKKLEVRKMELAQRKFLFSFPLYMN